MIRKDIQRKLVEKILKTSNEYLEKSKATKNLSDFIRDIYIKNIPKEVQSFFDLNETRFFKTTSITAQSLLFKDYRDLGEFFDQREFKGNRYDLAVELGKSYPLMAARVKNLISEDLINNGRELFLKYCNTHYNYDKLEKELFELFSRECLSSDLLKKNIPELFK